MVAAVASSHRSSNSSLGAEVLDGVRQLSLDKSAFIALLVDFDLGGEWAFDNAPSCAHWVADRAGTEIATVREWLRIGHALAGVDEVARRFADGRLSYSKVRAVTRLADADSQHELCAVAERFPASRVAFEWARWLKNHEVAEALEKRHRAATKLSWHLDVDGMIVGSFRYPPEVAAVRRAAVDAHLLRTLRGRHAPAGDRNSRSVTIWPGSTDLLRYEPPTRLRTNHTPSSKKSNSAAHPATTSATPPKKPQAHASERALRR